MAIKDGQKIKITFDQPLVGDITTGNTAHFNATFNEYTYVPGGTLVLKTRNPIAIERFNTIDSIIALNTGSMTDVEIKNGYLVLEAQ